MSLSDAQYLHTTTPRLPSTYREANHRYNRGRNQPFVILFFCILCSDILQRLFLQFTTFLLLCCWFCLHRKFYSGEKNATNTKNSFIIMKKSLQDTNKKHLQLNNCRKAASATACCTCPMCTTIPIMHQVNFRPSES